MPTSRFNRSAWPESGPHRDLLEFLDAVHRVHGTPSLRAVGLAMHLSYTRVHDIVRGASMPVSDEQVRTLTRALLTAGGGEGDAAVEDEAVALFVAARQARDVPEPPVAGTAPRRRTRTIVVAVAALLVLAAGGLALTRTGDARGTVVLQDSFDGTTLDAERWLPPTRGDLIYPRDGALNFRVGPTDTEDGAEARLSPAGVDGFRQLDLVVGEPSLTLNGPGGPSITLRETDGRTHRFLFGPGTEGPYVAALICRAGKQECHTYDDYDPPGQYVLFRTGETVPVRITQADDGRVQFFARDQLFAQGPPGDAPLQTFTVDLYGAKSEAWLVTVESLTVTR